MMTGQSASLGAIAGAWGGGETAVNTLMNNCSFRGDDGGMIGDDEVHIDGVILTLALNIVLTRVYKCK